MTTPFRAVNDLWFALDDHCFGPDSESGVRLMPEWHDLVVAIANEIHHPPTTDFGEACGVINTTQK